MIELLLGPLAPYLTAAAGAVVMFVFGYRSASRARAAKDAGRRLEDMKKAQEVRDEVEALDDIGLARRAAKWLHKAN